jgi:tRNA threonylcarbamoyladenosine biosynthesis protein TsaB
LDNILAIETSTDTCSVSIGNCQHVYSYHKNIPKQHTEKLLSVINNLLEESNLSYKDLSALAVGIGPGSYTGVRLSCAVAQGIAFSQQLRGITLPSTELLSIQAHEETSSNNIVAISELKMGKVYISQSIFSEGNMKSSYSLIPQEAFNREVFPEDCCFVGEGCSSFNVTNQLPGAHPRATYLLKYALKKLEQGDLIEPDEILPIYLNDESSWQKVK